MNGCGDRDPAVSLLHMSEALDGLAEIARLETEREGLVQRLAVAERQVAEAHERHREAMAKVATESTDVERLESLSITRILAGLRGTRDVDLSRERAEQLAARYAAAQAESRLNVARREKDDLIRRLEALQDLEARRAVLLAQREREIAADPSTAGAADRLAELAGRRGELEAQAVQLREALTAAERACTALRDASRHLDSAGGWASYDTFLGGGLIADLVKHHKLDTAAELMRRADAALAHLATELADVDVAPVGSVGVSQLSRALDIWFDNIFTDFQVRERFRSAATRVNTLLRDVDAVGHDLARRLGDVREATQELEASRRAVLLG